MEENQEKQETALQDETTQNSAEQETQKNETVQENPVTEPAEVEAAEVSVPETEKESDKTEAEPEKKAAKKKKKEKRKKPFIIRFFLGIFDIIFILVFIILVWLGVNYFIKADPTEYVPSDYTIHLRTDSVWDSVNPLLDLQAADILLAEPAFAGAKNALIDFRQSPLRENKYVDIALSRRMDLMVYEGNSYLAVLDTGFFSGAVRLLPLALNFFSVKNLSVVKTNGLTFLTYKAGNTLYYIQVNRNLVFVSPDERLFMKTFFGGKSFDYTDAKRDSFKGKLSTPFAVTADCMKILSMFGEDNSYIEAVKACLPEDQLASLDFGITDQKLKLALNAGYEISALPEDSPVAALLKKDSPVPAIVQKLPEFIQYYTVISAGTLEELKNGFFYAADSSLELEEKWKTAEKLSGIVFGKSVEELFFSWIGDEIAVVGLDQKPDPVFIVKVSDENKRTEVFDKIFSSLILKNDTSLIMDNVRLPRISFPDFIQGLLESFGVRIPSPYYMLKDGYLYISQSPENLASINAAIKSGTRLTQNSIWQETSKGISKHTVQNSSLSLFYNLERSIPFFLKTKSSVSKILELYNVGRMDIRIKDSSLEISLTSVETKDVSSTTMAGFPVELNDRISSGLLKSNIKNSRVVFYTQDNNLVSYNLSSQEKIEREFNNLKFILPSDENLDFKSGKNKPALWAVTKDGAVYLLDEKLKELPDFPIVTGYTPLSSGAQNKDGLVFCIPDQKYLLVQPKNASFTIGSIDAFDDITTTPLYPSSDMMVFYERSFLGGLHVQSKGENRFYSTEGIGYGSPDYSAGTGRLGFVSQTGLLHIIDPGKEDDPVKIQLEGVFYINVRACGDSFIALSEDGTLFSIRSEIKDDEEPEVVKVQVPHLTARSGFLSVADFDNDGKEEVFVCGDGNVIYGFRENLELIGSFPVTGYGEPLFIDLDGNKKNECVTYSLDNTINACRLIY